MQFGQEGSRAGIDAMAQECVALLRQAGWTVATAESLTGGGLAERLTSVPGASAAFAGGVVAYAPVVKVDVLGVDPGLVERRGTVDPEVAEQLAQGARRLLGADVGVSTTGSAGPDPAPGGTQTSQVPAGTAYIAVADADGVQVRSLPPQSGEGRAQVRAAVIDMALRLLRERLAATARTGHASGHEGRSGEGEGTVEV